MWSGASTKPVSILTGSDTSEATEGTMERLHRPVPATTSDASDAVVRAFEHAACSVDAHPLIGDVGKQVEDGLIGGELGGEMLLHCC